RGLCALACKLTNHGAVEGCAFVGVPRRLREGPRELRHGSKAQASHHEMATLQTFPLYGISARAFKAGRAGARPFRLSRKPIAPCAFCVPEAFGASGARS